jgi:ankyrin repeat protein
MFMKQIIYSDLLKTARWLMIAIFMMSMTPLAHADDDLDTFWVAVRNDKAAQVQTLMQRGVANPNTLDPDTNSPLIEAIKTHSWKVYDVVLHDKRVDVNVKNRVGETALMYLALEGQLDRMKDLIARGAQVNQPGWTALHYAATKGNDDEVRLLLDNYAYIDAESPDKTTPLMMAMRYDHESTVNLLLDEGSDGYFKNAQGKNAADVARDAGNTIIATKFIERLNAERQRKQEGH